MLKTYTLKNGLKVATYEIPQMKSVSLALTVKAGSVFDKEKTNGTAHFMEHILAQGIPSYPTVEELSDFVESLAGFYNAHTTQLTVSFTMNAPANHLRDCLRISSEAFLSPLFPEGAIEKERNAVLEEIKQNQDTLQYKNYKHWKETRFKKGHPAILDVGGSIEGVQKIKKEDLINYWKEFFYPKNMYLVLVGGIKNSDAQKKINEIFGKYQSNDKFPGFPKVFSNNFLTPGGVTIRGDQSLKTCYVSLSFPSISADSPVEDRVTQSIIRTIMGGLRSSRLHRLLRQRRGLVYGVSFRTLLYPGLGYCDISTEAVSENLEEVISLIAQELKSLINDGPTDQEIEFAKNFFSNRTLMSFDSPQGVASWIEDDLIWEDEIRLPDESVELIKKVDKNKIMELIKKYWNLDKLLLDIQGPIENSEDNIRKFKGMLKDLR